MTSENLILNSQKSWSGHTRDIQQIFALFVNLEVASTWTCEDFVENIALNKHSKPKQVVPAYKEQR